MGAIDPSWRLLIELQGSSQAEILRSLLEAQGIQVLLSQEGAGRAMGLQVGPLGTTQVLVPSTDLEQAKVVLEDYQHGRLEND